ncbi:MAG: hypothetical protein HY870_13200 [Chloroflexi bacterium]|nr:hypothetical protein [Chloroflexota bacterium]
MNTSKIDQYLTSYEAGTQSPEVSGLEHLNMLMVRDWLAGQAAQQTSAQSARLRAADQTLLKHASQFLQAIRQIADLESWREQEHATSDRWWWYLDVIAYLPLFEADQFEPAQAALPPLSQTARKVIKPR